MHKLESVATAVTGEIALAFRRSERSAIVTLQLEEFAQHLAYCALMVQPEGGINSVSLFLPVTVNSL